MSMRMPSRQPSMVSLRPHSPNPSIGRQGIIVEQFTVAFKTPFPFFNRSNLYIFLNFISIFQTLLCFFSVQSTVSQWNFPYLFTIRELFLIIKQN